MALMLAAREVDAVAITLAVFALIFAANELDAFVTSDCTASEPAVSPAPVRVRVAKVQTSDAVRPAEPLLLASCLPIVPAPVRVDVAIFHTSAARVPNVVR